MLEICCAVFKLQIVQISGSLKIHSICSLDFKQRGRCVRVGKILTNCVNLPTSICLKFNNRGHFNLFSGGNILFCFFCPQTEYYFFGTEDYSFLFNRFSQTWEKFTLDKPSTPVMAPLVPVKYQVSYLLDSECILLVKSHKLRW